MAEFFRVMLPVSPGINEFYKSFLNPKTGRSAFAGTSKARAFKKVAALQLKTAQIDWNTVELIREEKRKKKHVPLEMTISFFYESRWRKDIDAGEKAVIDACFKHLRLNDNLVVAKHTFKFLDKIDPRVEVSLCIFQE